MTPIRRRVDVDLDELDQVLDGARQAPLSETDYDKLKGALHALAALLVRPRNTEKTSAVLDNSDGAETGTGAQSDADAAASPGHGRNGAEAFSGARKIDIKHQMLTHGDRCPECGKGNVYAQKEPKTLVRVVGQAPLAAAAYSLERLRCGACGQVFTAQEPEGVGAEKYDETAAAMIAQLKYGSGVPFYRLEQLEDQLGIPLPAATQWEIVEEQAELLEPARDELIRQAAQGEVVHNDDTSMRVLRLAREASDAPHGCVHQRHRIDRAGLEDRAVLHRTPACRREPCRRFETAGPAVEPAHSNVRRAVAQRSEVIRGCGDSTGQLPRSRKTSVCGSCGELPRPMPLCAGDARARCMATRPKRVSADWLRNSG
jgi:transposase